MKVSQRHAPLTVLDHLVWSAIFCGLLLILIGVNA